MDIEIGLLTEEDIPQAMELKNALGWNQTPEDWRRFLMLSPRGCFKATRAGQLVATANAYVFDRVCWIGMMIVRLDCRHHGVGRRMMRRCLEYSAQEGSTLVVLDATRDGVALYGSLGFRPDFLVGTARGRISERSLSAEPAAGIGGWAIRRVTARDLEAVVSLDAGALGAVREALLHYLIREHPGRGFVCHDEGGRLHGFVLYRRGFHSVQVGPVIARDDECARMLLRAAFSDLVAGGMETPVVLTVPMNNAGTQSIIRRWGLAVDLRLTRMYRGQKRLHAREDMVYALSGPEKG
jgi:predicted N-acetyltransferase YhbS